MIEQMLPQSAINTINMMKNSYTFFNTPWMTSKDHANTIKMLTDYLKSEIRLYREAVAREETPYDNGIDISEVPWDQMTPEEKASIMFPDMSTLPLTEEEKKTVNDIFAQDSGYIGWKELNWRYYDDNDVQNG